MKDDIKYLISIVKQIRDLEYKTINDTETSKEMETLIRLKMELRIFENQLLIKYSD